jgi:hypothetical protein
LRRPKAALSANDCILFFNVFSKLARAPTERHLTAISLIKITIKPAYLSNQSPYPSLTIQSEKDKRHATPIGLVRSQH